MTILFSELESAGKKAKTHVLIAESRGNFEEEKFKRERLVSDGEIR